MGATIWETTEGKYRAGTLVGEKHVGTTARCLECNWSGTQRPPTPAGAVKANADADEHNQSEHADDADNSSPSDAQ